eukprot:COSAG02_NODE_3123_length_7322_cov_42.435553_6_plen_98_part_00
MLSDSRSPRRSEFTCPGFTSFARSTFALLVAAATHSVVLRCGMGCAGDACMYGQMGKDSGVSLDLLKVDGGMCVNNRLMQIQADLLGVVSTHWQLNF